MQDLIWKSGMDIISLMAASIVLIRIRDEHLDSSGGWPVVLLKLKNGRIIEQLLVNSGECRVRSQIGWFKGHTIHMLMDWLFPKPQEWHPKTYHEIHIIK